MRGVLLLGLALLAAWLLADSAYVVTEREQAIILEFGKPVGKAITTPGLRFKTPLIQQVRRFDKRWLEWDGQPREMPTREKTYILVDTFARWRIVDPLRFYARVGDVASARSRITDILGSETRNVVAAHDLIDVVRTTNNKLRQPTRSSLDSQQQPASTKAPSPAEHAEFAEQADQTVRSRQAQVKLGREKLRRLILKKARAAMPDYGIELVDVRFQRVNYTESVRQKVYERMISERNRIAQRYRSQGQGKSAQILGQTERELSLINAQAYKKVQQIEGQADAQAASIYAQAYTQEPGLFKLTRSLRSLTQSVDKTTRLILPTDAEYLQPLIKAVRR